MAAKRVIATLLFILAFIGVAAFVFLLFANAEGIDRVPGSDELSSASIITIVILGIVALILIILLAIRSFDEKEESAEEAEPFFIPEEEQQKAEAKQNEAVHKHVHRHKIDAVVAKAPTRGPVDVVDLNMVPLGSQAWSGSGQDFSFHFPRPAKHGLFSNDYVDIGGGIKVKMATLIAAPQGAFNGVQAEAITPPSTL